MDRIAVAGKAGRQLNKLAKRNQKDYLNVITGIERLRDWPNIQEVKKLVKHSYTYRLRVGRYRILFDVADAIGVIEVQEVKKRDESTY